jgi:hypothetical protein
MPVSKQAAHVFAFPAHSRPEVRAEKYHRSWREAAKGQVGGLAAGQATALNRRRSTFQLVSPEGDRRTVTAARSRVPSSSAAIRAIPSHGAGGAAARSQEDSGRLDGQ